MTNPNLPAEFWAARPLLTGLRQYAWSRFVSPDAVLHAMLAAYSWRVPVGYTVENPGGAPIYLIHQPLIIGPSGSGKTAASKVGRDMLHGETWGEILHPTHNHARSIMRSALGNDYYYVTPFDPSLPDNFEAIEGYDFRIFDPKELQDHEQIDIPLSADLRTFLQYLGQQALRGEIQEDRRAQERILRTAALLRLMDGENLPWGYTVTVEDWNLALAMNEASNRMRTLLEEEIVQELVEKYAARILDRVGSGKDGVPLSTILQGWSSLNTRSTLRDVVLPALVADGTLTLQDGRYTA